MEGSSETSLLGEPIITKFAPTLSAVESVNSVQNQDFSDATSFAEINSPMLLIDDASTPKKKQACSQEGSLYKPQCDEELKPKVGMLFDDIGSVMEFYKTYAHHVGFGVRLGQQKIVDDVLQWKRFLCAKEGFRPEKGMVGVDPSKKRRKVKLTRCGCQAFIYVTWESDGKYRIAFIYVTRESGEIEFLHTSLCNAELTLAQLVPAVACNTHENEESFIGSIIPKHVTIHTPTDINARGTCSRIKGHRDGVRSGSSEKKRRPGIHQKVARKCSICKEVAFHDARTCSKKQMTQQ